MTNLLFVCSRNRFRSPTAEAIFAGRPGIETDSGGLAPDAEVQLSSEQVQWADIILVMERSHLSRLKSRFGRHLNGKRVVSLDIPDNYAYMAPKLIERLERAMRPYLPR